MYTFLYFFFFKQKTAYEMRISDWSSDVCSSDLQAYLTRTARNLLIERHRTWRRKGCVLYPLDETRDAAIQPDQEWRIQSAELRRAYRRALLAMPRRTRRIFLMHRLKGMRSEERRVGKEWCSTCRSRGSQYT